MKYVLLLLVGTGVFVSCKKANGYNANILFYNASWSLPSISAAWNDGSVVSSLAQGKVSGTADAPYLQVPAGTNLVTIKAGSTALLNKNIYTASAKGSSFIVFDTSTGSFPVRILQLTDDLTLPDTTQVKYRILNLVPDTAVHVDIWLVNGATDSIRLDTAGSFIGSTVAASAAEPFTSFSYTGNRYTVKVKKTGTQQVYTSLANYMFAKQGIYSIIFSGLLTGTGATALQLSVLYHHTQ